MCTYSNKKPRNNKQHSIVISAPLSIIVHIPHEKVTELTASKSILEMKLMEVHVYVYS